MQVELSEEEQKLVYSALVLCLANHRELVDSGKVADFFDDSDLMEVADDWATAERWLRALVAKFIPLVKPAG